MPEGLGNIQYNNPPGSTTSGTVTGANDGLVDTANIVKLGQTVGAAGDPAALTENREIPLDGNTLYVGKSNLNTVGFDDNGISQFNNNGEGYLAQLEVGANTTSFQISSPDGSKVDLTFANTDLLEYDGALHTLISSIIFGAPAYNGNLIQRVQSVNPTFAWDNSTDTLVYDTTAGNASVTIVPANFVNRKGTIKKKGADANSITLTPSTGSVYGSAGPVASYTFSVPGESISFHCDGTDIYII